MELLMWLICGGIIIAVIAAAVRGPRGRGSTSNDDGGSYFWMWNDGGSHPTSHDHGSFDSTDGGGCDGGGGDGGGGGD